MRADLDIPILLDRSSGQPVGKQVVGQLRRAIADGLLRTGNPLPSTRVLAQRLGVARSTIVACYLELEGEGWVTTSHGAGTFVAAVIAPGNVGVGPAGAGRVGDPRTAGGSPSGGLGLRPGDLDPRLIATTEWRRAWHAVVPAGVPPPSPGTAELRLDLADYLASSRGLRCRPEEVVVCSGTMEALLVLALALGWPCSAIAVEDPGYPPVGRLLAALGARILPLEVTDPSEVPARLAALTPVPAAVYLTPSHQHPLGHRMSSAERYAVLDWSDDNGSVLIEDDYDGEFRYDVAPVPSMAGMRPDSRVAYVGSMSKVLDPGLRVAYLRVPSALLPAVLEARETLGSTVSAQVQHAVSRMIRSGELARHIARMRRIYAERRRVLLGVLADLPGIQGVRGLEAGLHVVAELHPRLRAADIVTAAAARGLRIADLDEFRSHPDLEQPGLVISYSSGEPTGLRRAAEILRQCIQNG